MKKSFNRVLVVVILLEAFSALLFACGPASILPEHEPAGILARPDATPTPLSPRQLRLLEKMAFEGWWASHYIQGSSGLAVIAWGETGWTWDVINFLWSGGTRSMIWTADWVYADIPVDLAFRELSILARLDSVRVFWLPKQLL